MKNKQAHVNWNAGICRVIEPGSQRIVAQSRSFQRATRKARNLGFDVTVYGGRAELASVKRLGGKPQGEYGGYVLPAREQPPFEVAVYSWFDDNKDPCFTQFPYEEEKSRKAVYFDRGRWRSKHDDLGSRYLVPLDEAVRYVATGKKP